MAATAQVQAYTSPRHDVLELIPRDVKTVLDIGCSDGSLGVALAARQPAEVTGVEIDPAYAELAQGRLARVLVEAAEAAIAELEAEAARFDCVICADVLEHLARPGEVLGAAAGLLNPGGTVMVSLPNVRYYETFVQLGLRGRWPRHDRGVHDRTHLQWFTDADARELFASAGLQVQEQVTHYRLRDSYRHPLNRHAARVARGPLRPFLAYQYLYRLRRPGPPPAGG